MSSTYEGSREDVICYLKVVLSKLDSAKTASSVFMKDEVLALKLDDLREQTYQIFLELSAKQ